MKPTLVVHGGCGLPPAGEEDARRAAVERAADEGWAALERGASALEACCAAIVRLKDVPQPQPAEIEGPPRSAQPSPVPGRPSGLTA